MKKALSVILALILAMSCFSVAFAADEAQAPAGTYEVCECDDCKKADGCTCCIYCPYLNEDYILKQCAKVEVVDGKRYVVFCCANCTGIFPCDCGTRSECGCKTCDGSSIEKDDGTGEPILTPEQQEEFVTGFQKIMKVLADAFNKFFDAIFEFLRLEEFLGSQNA